MGKAMTEPEKRHVPAGMGSDIEKCPQCGHQAQYNPYHDWLSCGFCRYHHDDHRGVKIKESSDE